MKIGCFYLDLWRKERKGRGKREEVESLYKGAGVLCNKSLTINSGSVKNEGDVLGNYF